MPAKGTISIHAKAGPPCPIRRILASILATGLLLVPALRGADTWSTPEEAAGLIREMTDFFAGAEVRLPGSPGNLALEEKVAGIFAGSGFKHGEISFTAPRFIPGETRLFLDQHQVPLQPLHPTLFRPGNFPEQEVTTDLVYLGRGTGRDLDHAKGIMLEHSIALMEFDCGTTWLDLLPLGVKGFIFIDRPGGARYHALAKVPASEVALPRFWVDAASGAMLKTACSTNRKVSVQIQATPSRWENRTLRDLWVMIPGRHPDLSREIAVILAPLDSNSVVPGLAAGAQNGANLFYLTRLLREFQVRPPARAVLLAAVNAHTEKFLGERMLAWYLCGKGQEKVREALNTDRRIQQLFVEYYRPLQLATYRPEDDDYLVRLRSLTDNSTARVITVKNPLIALARHDVNRLKSESLQLLQMKLSDTYFEARRLALEQQRKKHVNVLTLFNKVGIMTRLKDLSPEERRILKDYVDEVIRTNQRSAELNLNQLRIDSANSQIQEVLQGRRVTIATSLELDWSSDRLGFCSSNWFGYNRWAVRFGFNTGRLAAALPEVRAGRPNLLLDTMTVQGGLTESFFFPRERYVYVEQGFPGRSGIGYFQTAGIPAFALKNVFTDDGRAFLPDDTFEHLEPARTASLMAFSTVLLQSVLNDPLITTTPELSLIPDPDYDRLWSAKINTFKFDDLSASVLPEIPVPDAAIVLRGLNFEANYAPFVSHAIVSGDVINAYLALTDERASAVFYGMIERDWQLMSLSSSVFHFDPSFSTIDHALDAGDMQKKITTNLGLPSNYFFTEYTLPLFECREFPILTPADPTLINNAHITSDSLLPLSSTGNAAPRRYGLTTVMSLVSDKYTVNSAGAPFSFFFNRGDRIKLVTPQKRLALNATPEFPEGQGFANASEMGPDLLADMARDMGVLNRARMDKLPSVTSELSREFQRRGQAAEERATTARTGADWGTYFPALYEALGAQVKCYGQIKQTSDDMLKAVVVYMALLLPFCLFIQKLCFNFVRIEKQMAAFAILFVCTFLLFRMIHPAFRVAQAAEAIFIAFVMGALGLFVISLLHGRFQGEMRLLFQRHLGLSEDEVGMSTVGQKAMLVGVNNMKRRRMRTSLTTATIILIAFTMLSFTSITRKLHPTLISKSLNTPYTGLMFHWPGKAQMDESTCAALVRLFETRGQIVVRRWSINTNPLLLRTGAGRETRFEALLGLAAAENGFLQPMPLIAGRFFSRDDAPETVLFASTAAFLGIDPASLDNATVDFQGRTLRVVGVLDDSRFAALRDLNGNPLMPIKRVVKKTGADQETATKSDDENQTDEGGVAFFANTSSLLLVPVELAQEYGARPYSFSVKLNPGETAGTAADLMLTVTEAKFFLGSQVPFTLGPSDSKPANAGIYYVGSNYSTSIGGLAVLLVPLLIASTIILNTMLGSVYERKREIAIYNAVGLNPHHIALFFLAEALVYGVLGSVGGYLIGQVLAALLNQTGWFSDIHLNYSSLSVAYVILFTIAVVLLSTIYPAMVATKAAVPSGKRRWSLPAHDGHRMTVVFPFIYHPRLASGVLVYLREYFDYFTGVSIGDLTANPQGWQHGTDSRGRDTYSLEYEIALAPFDLGVTEHLAFHLAYEERVQAYRLQVIIRRISGQDANWITTNRPFLERLRKYLMHWRNLDAARHALYAAQAASWLGAQKVEG